MSEVAKATRMKIQMIDDLEHENFSRIAAPIYGKGFIRLYAELVGIDPNPLINEYLSTFSEYRKATLDVDDMSGHANEQEARSATKQEHSESKPNPDLFAHMAVPVDESTKQADSSTPAHNTTQHMSSMSEALSRLFGGMIEQTLSFFRRFGQAAHKAIPSRILETVTIGSKAHKISVAILLIILLVFIISSLSRCSGKNPADDQTSTKAPMPIAVQPPATYVE